MIPNEWQHREEYLQARLVEDIKEWTGRIGMDRAMAICHRLWPDEPLFMPDPVEPPMRHGRCKAATSYKGQPCNRGAVADGLCYQHGYMKRRGKWDVRWGAHGEPMRDGGKDDR